jgi:hypothetical protein
MSNNTSYFLEIPSMWPIPDGKGHWITRERLVFYSGRFGVNIIIEAGSVNNLASIPWLFRRLFSINGPTRPAAMLHDPLYELEGKVLGRDFTKDECDLIFYDALVCTKRSVFDSYPHLCQGYLEKREMAENMLTYDQVCPTWLAKTMLKGLQCAFWRRW